MICSRHRFSFSFSHLHHRLVEVIIWFEIFFIPIVLTNPNILISSLSCSYYEMIESSSCYVYSILYRSLMHLQNIFHPYFVSLLVLSIGSFRKYISTFNVLVFFSLLRFYIALKFFINSPQIICIQSGILRVRLKSYSWSFSLFISLIYKHDFFILPKFSFLFKFNMRL